MFKNFYVIGNGSDAPGIIITVGSDGKIIIKRVPGWNPEALVEVSRALEIIGQASQLKEKGLAESVIANVMPMLQQQLGEHAKEGGVMILGA